MIYIVYHDKCTDGFGAALVAWQKYQESAQYIPLNHYDPVPNFKPGSKIICLDFCFNKATLINLARHHEVLVLDHHQSAFKEVEDLILQPIKNLDLRFNMSQSGVEMAWKYFNEGQALPLLFNHIKDRDLGLFALPKTQQIISALMTVPKEFKIWSELSVKQLAERGEIIEQVQHQMMVEMCDKHHFAYIGGVWVPAVNATCWWSDVTKILLQKYPDSPFVAAYYTVDSTRTKWSLRSLPGGSDVAEISTPYGGGGHPNSGGFTAKTGSIKFSQEKIAIKKVA
jgi:hypothetical protein